MQNPTCRDKDLLTKEQYDLVKSFTSRPEIIIRKSDKSNACVIMDRSDYDTKLTQIVNDENKFQKISKDDTESLKNKINGPQV